MLRISDHIVLYLSSLGILNNIMAGDDRSTRLVHTAVHVLQSSSVSYVSCGLLQKRGGHVGNHIHILLDGHM